MTRTDRLLAILLEFQARGDRRAEDLARAFEVSVRTIYRDIEALCESGVPVVGTPGAGYRLMEGYFLPPLSFTAEEAIVLLLGGELVRGRVDPPLQAAADAALARLAAALPPAHHAEAARRREAVLFAGVERPPPAAAMTTLRAAVEQQRVVRLLYHAYRRLEPEPREVEPIALVHLGSAWHLAAWCRDRRAPRLFRLERIDRLAVLPERFERDGRHVLGDDRMHTLDRFPEATVRVDPAAARWLRERLPFFFLCEQPGDDGPRFVFALHDETEVARWLLGWGAAVEVLTPRSLRRRLAAEVAAVLHRYAGDNRDEVPDRPVTPDTTLSGARP